MAFDIPASVLLVRDALHAFVTERVEPAEPVPRGGGPEAAELVVPKEYGEGRTWEFGLR